ncbi:MAG: 5'-nucleotidase C-terminal domain-containing protein, partial [Proteobacteria bacterium]|nr:5'-nucleotidase C-terminal domain-containing protein [Pseudomonadota bacterium]
AEVLAVLEQQFEGGRAALPAFLRVSGLRYVYDLTRPSGNRVLAADGVDGRPLDPARRYTVVANDYIVGGGDRYSAFAAGHEATPLMTDLEALATYLTLAPQPLQPHLDGRVRAFATAR